MTKEPEEGNKAPEPIWTEGHKICKSLKEGSVSSVELMENIYSRIELINPEVNAIVNLLPKEEALSLAKENIKHKKVKDEQEMEEITENTIRVMEEKEESILH